MSRADRAPMLAQVLRTLAGMRHMIPVEDADTLHAAAEVIARNMPDGPRVVIVTNPELMDPLVEWVEDIESSISRLADEMQVLTDRIADARRVVRQRETT